jgi:formylglycine-generating enzyme required for sulfatase activity
MAKWEDDEEMEPKPGLLIRNNYRLVEQLGSGGMCVVWKAIDLIQETGEARNSEVAIKFLSRNFKRHPDALKALVREFNRYNRLSHPNILKAHNLDCIGDTYFLVMELLKGIPLKQFIKSHPSGISLIEAKPIIKDMAEALAYAHQEGIAHLDFKPANVFYDPDDNIAKLIDFGIARPLEQSERDETRFDPGSLGAITDPYASYEMLLALDTEPRDDNELEPDPRDDIYGLACVTYELLSGKHPFKRKKATIAKYKKLSPNPIKGLNNKQNQALWRALAFYRDERTPTASQFLAELFPEKKWLSWAEDRATKQRRQLEQKVAEERRQAELARQQAEENRRLLEQAEEKIRQLEQKVAEERRQAELARQQAEEKIRQLEIEKQKVAEERRQAEENKGKLFKFQIVTVNARGKIIKRIPKKARYQTEDLGNGVTLEMVYIPEGRFLMGSPETEKGRNSDEGPQHQVTLEPFYMGKYPVTQAQYKAVMGKNPSYFKSWFKGKNRPVEQVSWHDAVEFCKRLSEMTGRTYRLPSEAQWEYAIRAGTTTPFYFGETITSKLANYNGNYTYASESKGVYRGKTTDVGSFPPNAFGLYDMHGNVWEWCADTWHDNYDGAPTDGSVWEEDTSRNNRVLRGGSWFRSAGFCRAAFRSWYVPVAGLVGVGFRVVWVART